MVSKALPLQFQAVMFYTVRGRHVCSKETLHRESVGGIGVGVGMGPGGHVASLAPLQSRSGQSPAQRLGPGQSLPLWLQSPCWHNGTWTG